MSYSISAAACWVVLAAVLAAIPSNDNHWRRAYALMALDLPILVWVFWENGLWVGLVCLVGFASFLRWPVRFAWAWLRRKLSPETE